MLPPAKAITLPMNRACALVITINPVCVFHAARSPNGSVRQSIT